MSNPKDDGVLRRSIVSDDDTEQRIIRLKHLLESRDGKNISVSELIRFSLRELEKTLVVPA